MADCDTFIDRYNILTTLWKNFTSLDYIDNLFLIKSKHTFLFSRYFHVLFFLSSSVDRLDTTLYNYSATSTNHEYYFFIIFSPPPFFISFNYNKFFQWVLSLTHLLLIFFLFSTVHSLHTSDVQKFVEL